MKLLRFSQEEIQFLKDNYRSLGRKKCSIQLNRTLSSIASKIKKLKITCSPEEIRIRQAAPKKEAGQYKIKENLFIKDFNVRSVYLLGLIWADGYLQIQKHSRLRLQLIENDARNIEPIIDSTGIWSKNIVYSQKGKKNLQFSCSNPILCSFLNEQDYKNKSFLSPDKILDIIPKHLHKYFFLGYLDGDGCIFAKGKHFVITFTSTHQQNWNFLERLCQTLKCKYYIKRYIRKNKNSKYSSFSIYGYKNCFVLGNYLYEQTENIYLPRKYQQFLAIQNKQLSKKTNYV